ncbi:hypothetical protein LVW35_05210 [Pseudomonas sp. HN11]|uniref:hypothetical protein n=1 Tax=Pseudomonas sp. HN11 TaxID=1344094 RepID=UPI001F261548|nr:hypothetical protein [Pseudomonas sp. HN11]UII72578.1 hypothetical protein LVW35_05210 [Pseudomonas sp. HN11]
MPSLPSGSAPALTSSTTINSRQPLLQGMAAPYAIVHVFLAGGSVNYGSARADQFGNWSLTPNQPLATDAYGKVSIALAEFDTAGQQRSPWTGANLILSTSAGGGGTTPGGAILPPGSPPVLTSSTTINSRQPLLQGVAAPYAIVQVLLAGGSVNYGSARADQFGNWSLTPNQPLATDAYGNVSIALAEFNTAGQQLSPWTGANLILSTGAGGGGTTPGNTPRPAGSAPVLTSSTTVSASHPFLQGLATPYSTIWFYNASGSIFHGQAQANASGNWSLILHPPLQPDAQGNALIQFAEYSTANQPVSGWATYTLKVV